MNVTYRSNRPTRTIELGKGPDNVRRSLIARSGTTYPLTAEDTEALKGHARAHGILEDFTFSPLPVQVTASLDLEIGPKGIHASAHVTVEATGTGTGSRRNRRGR